MSETSVIRREEIPLEPHTFQVSHADILQICLAERIQNNIITLQTGMDHLPELTAVLSLTVVVLVLAGIAAELPVRPAIFYRISAFETYGSGGHSP